LAWTRPTFAIDGRMNCREASGSASASREAITRSELHAEFKRVKAAIDRAVILVTHDIAEALLLADRVAVLHDGRIIACAPGPELQCSSDPRVTALVTSR
jgi:osmoprotectant transport system ATP-binding protein